MYQSHVEGKMNQSKHKRLINHWYIRHELINDNTCAPSACSISTDAQLPYSVPPIGSAWSWGPWNCKVTFGITTYPRITTTKYVFKIATVTLDTGGAWLWYSICWTVGVYRLPWHFFFLRGFFSIGGCQEKEWWRTTTLTSCEFGWASG
jgi:hypothetical protein